MIGKEFLRENFEVSGVELNDFYELLDDIVKHTRVDNVPANSISTYTLADNPGSPDRHNYFSDTAGHMVSEDCDADVIAVCGYDSDLASEVSETSGLLLEAADGRTYATSLTMLPTLGLRLGLGAAVGKPCAERDVFVTRLLHDLGDRNVTLIAHEVDDAARVFAVASDRYTYIPQTVIRDVINDVTGDEKLGKIKCLGWHVDNQYSEINIAFLDFAKDITATYGISDFIPGLQVISSDTTDSSLIVRGIWYPTAGYGRVVQSEIRKAHKGSLDMEQLHNRVDHEIFDEYRKFPERLCELMKISLTSSEYTADHNMDILSNCIKDIFRDMDMVSIVGKKNETVLREGLISELNPGVPYTAYDMAMMIIDLPNRIETKNTAMISKLTKAAKTAVYRNYTAREEEIISLSA